VITETEADRQSAVDAAGIRVDFPILHQQINGTPLVYLDNAATTQKPRVVIDRMVRYYAEENANVHRGVHHLSARATDAYEAARRTARRFLNAADDREIVFVRGTTEAINLVAHSYGRERVGRGDEVIVSEMEHHSNIVPWQILCRERGATLRVVPITNAGEMRLDVLESLLNDRSRLVAISHVSNVLGTINPIAEIVRIAHRAGVPVLVDGAQAAAHTTIDVQALGCDFYALSGHKALGPTGIGILWGRGALLDDMPPYQGGGSMIGSVSFAGTTYNVPPYRFEAGTPNVAGAVGLAAALDYLQAIGLDRVASYEHELAAFATDALAGVPGLRLIGTAAQKVGVLSFVLDEVHPHDIGTILDQQGIAIRAGHHCCQPLMDRLGVPATARASLALYNTREDVEALVKGLATVREVFG
jgi:cysteine desulfurase / selenocysteine lyase